MKKNEENSWIDCPRITVTWADHYSEFEQGWSLEEIAKLVAKPCIRKTTGYLLPVSSKRQIAVAGTIEEDGTASEIFVCMKKVIIAIEYLD